MKFLRVLFCLIFCNVTSSNAMSLTLGAALTDRIDHGSDASLDTCDPCSWAGWFYPTTITGNRILISKGTNVTGKVILLESAGSGGIQLFMARTVALNYTYNTGKILRVNRWWKVAVTLNTSNASGQAAHIYVAESTSTLTEVTYATQVDGSGPLTDDAAEIFLIGNWPPTNLSWQGQIGRIGFWKNRELQIPEFEEFFAKGITTSTGTSLSVSLGFNSNGTQYDDSGKANNGTVTGAVPSTNGPPIFFPGGPQ